jgi:hypothetical protein
MQPENPSATATPVSPTNTTLSTQRRARVRTAWVLTSVALVFFGANIVAQRAESSLMGIGALGFALVGFLWAAKAARSRV